MPAVCSHVSAPTLWHTCGSHTREAHSRMQCERDGLVSGRWALLESRANEQMTHPERARRKRQGASGALRWRAAVKKCGGEVLEHVRLECWCTRGESRIEAAGLMSALEYWNMLNQTGGTSRELNKFGEDGIVE